MSTLFRTKLRRIGNSMGVIIPKEIIEDLGFQGGDEIQIAIPSYHLKTRNEKIQEIAGKYAGKSAFLRDKGDRY